MIKVDAGAAREFRTEGSKPLSLDEKSMKRANLRSPKAGV
jgi:hypothetical protein